MRLRQKLCVVMVSVCVAAMFSRPAFGVVASDNFNDNSRDTDMWELVTVGAGSVTETNSQLQYTSSDANSNFNTQSYGLKRNVPYSESWTVTLEVHVGDYDETAENHEYGMAIVVANRDDTTNDMVLLSLVRGDDEGDGFFEWLFDKDTDGSETDYNEDEAASSDGTLKIVYDGTGDLAGYYDEGLGDGFEHLATYDVSDWGMGAGDNFALGIGGFDEECDFVLDDGAKMYADNFNLVPEPGVISLLVLGAAGLLRRRRRS